MAAPMAKVKNARDLATRASPNQLLSSRSGPTGVNWRYRGHLEVRRHGAPVSGERHVRADTGPGTGPHHDRDVLKLPLLVAALDGVRGQIYHASVQVHMWPDIPKKVRAGRHIVRVGWFDAEQDPHVICLISAPGCGRWELLVVPPELDPAIAARLMVTAATSGNIPTASILIASASAPSALAAGALPCTERSTARSLPRLVSAT